MRSLLIATIALLFTIAAGTAFAACTTPAGSEGYVRYDSTTKALYFCDGTNWKLASRKLCCGNTKTDGTGWSEAVSGSHNYVYRTINTSSCGFTSTPYYFTSMGGISHHANALGVSSIYSPTTTGFDLWIARETANDASAALADSRDWYINWCGVVDSSIVPAGSNGVLY